MTFEHILPPEIERFLKKYRTGMQIMLEGARAETGQTPKEMIWSRNKARLYRYEPAMQKRFSVPILLVYALINRPYILDLIPGNSLVEYLVDQGFDIYLLDWGIPGDEDAHLTLEHYVLDYLPRAVKKVLRASQAQELTLFGYCMGGTMSAMYAALFPDRPLKNLILLTTPTDFAPDNLGPFRLYAGEENFNLDLLVDAFGNIPGAFVDVGSRVVKPFSSYVDPYQTLWDHIMQDRPLDTWQAMNMWVHDGVPFPGEAFRQWIRDFYQQNKLPAGQFRLRGYTVDLSRIACPVLNIAGTHDQLCTLPQAEATMHLIGSQDKEFFVVDAGHVGLLTGSKSKRTLWPKVRDWLEVHST